MSTTAISKKASFSGAYCVVSGPTRVNSKLSSRPIPTGLKNPEYENTYYRRCRFYRLKLYPLSEGKISPVSSGGSLKLTYAGHRENISGLDLEFLRGDICHAKTVDKTMRGIDIVVHFAAESHVDRSILGPDAFIQTNVFGTYVLLQHALKHGVKLFHHVSTDEVFGALPLKSKHKFDELTPYAPHSPYSASKAASA